MFSSRDKALHLVWSPVLVLCVFVFCSTVIQNILLRDKSVSTSAFASDATYRSMPFLASNQDSGLLLIL